MEPEEFALMDALDHEILMHRDAHFGGLFSIMLDYYKAEKKGVQPEFDIARIERLASLEIQLKENLAALYLTGSEAIEIGKARDAYKKLRDIYEVNQPKSPYPRLIADLILAEDEEAEEEIAAIVAERGQIVPYLIDLIRSEEFYNPLFPGYGEGPLLAVECLAKIGDKRALISLFEALGKTDFFADEQIIKALKAIGEPAREFLLRVLMGRPLTEDNEKAAFALVAFKDDEEVANRCFTLLQDPEIRKDLCLPTYLALVSAGLKDPDMRETFRSMAEDRTLPAPLRADMQAVLNEWARIT